MVDTLVRGWQEVKDLKLLFSPMKIGSMELKNRLVMSAMGALIADFQRQLDFLGSRARGGPSLIIIPGGSIEPFGRRESPFRLYNDDFPPTIKQTLDIVHAGGARFGIQVNHGGRQSSSALTGVTPVAPSPIPSPVVKEMPRALETEEVKALVEKFAQGMRRAKVAGFDLVEVHGAHGYLVSQFLSPNANVRTDEYGGSVTNRARFVCQIVARARELVGPDYPISVRFNGSDHINGGMDVNDAVEVARLLEKAGASILNISAGVYGGLPLTIPPSYEPQGCYLHLAEAVKKAVNIPVIAVGRITDPRMAEDVLQRGIADLVAVARGMITDPEFPRKAMEGRFEDIRKCIGCNQGCMQIQDRRAPDGTCTVNPELGHEKEMALVPATRTKKIVVIGGGVAGMEAARVATLRGHRVVLYEEQERLGGQWHLAAAPPCKEDYLSYVEWQETQLKELGVQVKVGHRADRNSVAAESPDAVVIATGALPFIPTSVPGVNRPNVCSSWDILSGRVKPGHNVLIIGGNSVGLETAHFLSDKGHEVTVVEMATRFGVDLAPTVRWHLVHKLMEKKVRIETGAKLVAIEEAGVRVATRDGEALWKGYETVVLAVGARARNDLEPVLKDLVPELHVIGDAAKARNGLEAIREGAELGRAL